MSLFDRLKQGLSKTHQSVVVKIERLVGRGAVTEDDAEELFETLVAGDLGAQTAEAIVETLKATVRRGDLREPGALLQAVKSRLLEILLPAQGRLVPGPERPWVVFAVGVNGSGKTTTVAKLGHRWIGNGFRVSFAAADTFRAGAVEQLRIWSERTGAGFYSGKYGADPSGVVFDAASAARARGDDILLVDTAGRLHTSVNLMEELKKVQRTVGKALPGSPHEILLVLDATTGQNGLAQARMFHGALGLTGIALTKLDGTARGGIIVPVARDLGIPVKLVGVGEAEEDLQDFDAREFVEALFAD